MASALGGTFEFFGEKEAHFVDKPKKESYIPGEPHPTINCEGLASPTLGLGQVLKSLHSLDSLSTLDSLDSPVEHLL